MAKTQPTIRLTYLHGRGLGELPRLCLSYAGLEFEDVRLDEPIPDEFKAKLAYRQVPLLQYGEFSIVQSQAICRYIARKNGFYGDTPEESALIDQVTEGLADMRGKYSIMDSAKGDAKAPAKEEMVSKTIPHFYKLFSELLEKSGTGFFVGNKITYADIYMYYMNWNWHNRQDLFPGILLNFPLLKEHMDRIGADPKIAAWVAKRPVTPW